MASERERYTETTATFPLWYASRCSGVSVRQIYPLICTHQSRRAPTPPAYRPDHELCRFAPANSLDPLEGARSGTAPPGLPVEAICTYCKS